MLNQKHYRDIITHAYLPNIKQQSLSKVQSILTNFMHKVQVNYHQLKSTLLQQEIQRKYCFINENDQNYHKNECIIIVGEQFPESKWKQIQSYYEERRAQSQIATTHTTMTTTPNIEDHYNNKNGKANISIQIEQYSQEQQRDKSILQTQNQSLFNFDYNSTKIKQNNQKYQSYAKTVKIKKQKRLQNNNQLTIILKNPLKIQQSNIVNSSSEQSNNPDAIKFRQQIIQSKFDKIKSNLPLNLKARTKRIIRDTQSNQNYQENQKYQQTILIVYLLKNISIIQQTHHQTKLISILENYLSFKINHQIQMYSYKLGQVIQQFFFKNSVNKVQIYYQVSNLEQINFLEKLSIISKSSNNSIKQQTTKLYKLKAKQVSLGEQLKIIKQNFTNKINYLLALIDFRVYSYEEINMETMKLIKNQQIRIKTQKIKQLYQTQENLNVKLNIIKRQAQDYREKILNRQQQYLKTVSMIRNQIKNLQETIKIDKIEQNNKLYETSSINKSKSELRQSLNKKQSKSIIKINPISKGNSKILDTQQKLTILNKKRVLLTKKYENTLKTLNINNERVDKISNDYENKNIKYQKANRQLRLILANLQ